MMLRELRNWLFGGATARDAPDLAPTVEVATAVLLVEVMRSGPTLSAAERSAVLRILANHFRLLAAPAEALLFRAQEASRRAGDFYAFTSVVNAQLAQPEKIRMVERMWEIAFADGTAEAEEMHTISRLAGLLHVTHGEYIGAKLRAKETSGAAPAP